MNSESVAGDTTRVSREKIELVPTLRDLALVSMLGWALQLIATDLTVVEAFGGMAVLYALCAGGILLARFAPFYLPSVAWISALGIAATLPYVPWDQPVLDLVAEIDFLALAVPCLAYAGLAISRREIEVVKKSGWKLLLVAVFVLAGTYLGSALIADVVLRITG